MGEENELEEGSETASGAREGTEQRSCKLARAENEDLPFLPAPRGNQMLLVNNRIWDF